VSFCDADACSEQPEDSPDLALLRLKSPAWKIETAWWAKKSIGVQQDHIRFVGYGIKPPRLDNYNLKRISPIRISKCDMSADDNHEFCSQLNDEIPTPCHKDSGGPLYAVSGEGAHSLIGIAVRTGLGCRAGQAVYNDTASQAVQTWLVDHLARSKKRCYKNTHPPAEILSEQGGWLDKTDNYQELEFEVLQNLDELLITMNHTPGAALGDLHNDFDLELSNPEKESASLLLYCDNTWKLLGVCLVPSPAQGTWKARVTRKHGEGHFQLVATGITK
jgi:hypothetical protein